MRNTMPIAARMSFIHSGIPSSFFLRRLRRGSSGSYVNEIRCLAIEKLAPFPAGDDYRVRPRLMENGHDAEIANEKIGRIVERAAPLNC